MNLIEVNKAIKEFVILLFIFAGLASCNQKNSKGLQFDKPINKRISILDNSHKFTVQPANLDGYSYENLKNEIANILKTNSEKEVLGNYESLITGFKSFEIIIPNEATTKEEVLFNVLNGLDDLIFKYGISRLNFSDYKLLVVPNKENIKVGETLKAKVYLTVSDSLYDPEFKYKQYTIPCEKGVGYFQMVNSTKGQKVLNGTGIFSNEFGSIDTLNWSYQYEVK